MTKQIATGGYYSCEYKITNILSTTFDMTRPRFRPVEIYLIRKRERKTEISISLVNRLPSISIMLLTVSIETLSEGHSDKIRR
jgi:hypothetical protein